MTGFRGEDAAAARVEAMIRGFMDRSTENTLKDPNDEKAFAAPLVGFSRGDDPLYEAYKEHVGPFHLTPWELFSITFRGPPSGSRTRPFRNLPAPFQERWRTG